MLKNFSVKLKFLIKRLIGKIVYLYAYLKNYLTLSLNKINSPSAFIKSITKKWKTSLTIFFSIITIYYGAGALVSSNINNTLNKELKINPAIEQHSTIALTYVLKSQIDDTPWTPSLPLIFPASILDNLPNFQLGAKDAVHHIVKRMSALYLNQNLKTAGELLNYPSDIWLFSQDGNDKLSPGSAKQYRKALNNLKEFSSTQNIHYPLNTSHLISLLESVQTLLERQSNRIKKHTIEHNQDLNDTKADDIFYYTQGTLYTLHYYIKGLSNDYQDLIVEKELYEKLTTLLKNLSSATTLSPMVIKNSPLEDVYSSNHLIYLSYFIAEAKNILSHIIFSLKQSPIKEPK